MKISKPKPFAELVQSIKPEQWQLIGKYKAIDEQGRYLHWDKFGAEGD
ncbi:hypothetical protein [Gallibacterium salpingitidis]|nr:hypothetical protein [Gallibacterium salpingitidis]